MTVSSLYITIEIYTSNNDIDHNSNANNNSNNIINNFDNNRNNEE